jgi:hypothetical protein
MFPENAPTPNSNHFPDGTKKLKHRRLSRTHRTKRMKRIPPIDSIEHVRQLRGRDPNYAVRRRWPDEAAFLQPLGVQRHAETVMPKDLDQVTSGASKDVKITCVGIALQRFLEPAAPSHSCRASYWFAQPQAKRARLREPGSSQLQHIEYTPQCLRIDAAADADTVLAGKINLDCLRDGRRRRGDRSRLPVTVTGINCGADPPAGARGSSR